MLKIRKILTIILSVCLISVSVGSCYLDANHMSEVEATTVVVAGGIAAKTVFDICLFIGVTLGTCYVVGEVIDNKEEIARAGKNFIDSVTSIPDGWIMSMTDAKGQEYVLGSEALELIQGMDWEVIQGGAGGDNNNDDDDDDDKKGLLSFFGPAEEMVGSFTALGATWFYDTASKLYQKWTGGEELTETETAVIESFVSSYCNQYDIAAQWSGEPFVYKLDIDRSFDGVSYNGSKFWRYFDLDLSSSYSVPLACYHFLGTDAFSKPAYYFGFLQLYNGKVADAKLGVVLSTETREDGYFNRYPYSGGSEHSFSVEDNYSNYSISYSANFPVFGSREEAEAYLKGLAEVEDALNYAKVWRDADWLADDWQGVLIDPLTDINLTLSQLMDLCKALGIHAVGNNINPSELADLIAESLPEVNPELLPDAEPSPVVTPDPDLQPIYYPSPDAHPIPEPEPSPNPNPQPNPNPNPSPDVEPVTDTVDIDDIVPDLSSDFSDISGTLKTKFPFSLPWDLYYLLNGLASTPKTPVYELPLVIERLGINETIIIDMSDFEDISRLSRAMLSLIWAYALINWTVKIVSVRKED